MANITKESALEYHENGRPGKIEVVPTKPYATQTDLSLAYSPGVAFPCLEIQNDPSNVYKYTDKGNLVAVISNGTAVLGLGDIGAMSGKPVMEGKGLLFKIYGGVDVFDIEVDEKDPDKFCEAVERIAPTFGGINLEDIKAPECFYIEDRLKKNLNIPLMHDDQHGTAIISSAGLLNALEISGKKIEEIKIVVNGAGAAAISCTRMYVRLGARKENILMLDSKGVITADREKLTEQKREFATSRTDAHTLEEAIKGADMFLGLSKGNVLTQDMIRSMASNPIVFALANPTPEISYEDAVASRPDVLIATGRSDYPNQINNVLCFPYIFRGALDVHATAINEEMKVAAAHAIASLAKKPVPSSLNFMFKDKLKFGPSYFIPKPLDPRLLTTVSPAVAKAAMESGVAKVAIEDWSLYNHTLRRRLGRETLITQNLYQSARKYPCRVAFSDGDKPNVIRAASRIAHELGSQAVLVGDKESIMQQAYALKISLEGVEIVDPMSVEQSQNRKRYADLLSRESFRQGYTPDRAFNELSSSYCFALMMLKSSDVDVLIAGMHLRHMGQFRMASDILGYEQGFKHFAAINLINSSRGLYFIADTLINESPDKDTLKEIALLVDKTLKAVNVEPNIAMISHSSFGSCREGVSSRVHDVVDELHKEYPKLLIEGEMTVEKALDKNLRDSRYPLNTLKGKDVNALVFPSLTAGNSAFKLIKAFCKDVEVIGPVQMGLGKNIHFIDFEFSERDIMNIVASAIVIGRNKKRK